MRRCLHAQPQHSWYAAAATPTHITSPALMKNRLVAATSNQPVSPVVHSPPTPPPPPPFLPAPPGRLGQALAPRCIRRQAPCPPSKSPSRAVRPSKRNAPVPVLHHQRHTSVQQDGGCGGLWLGCQLPTKPCEGAVQQRQQHTHFTQTWTTQITSNPTRAAHSAHASSAATHTPHAGFTFHAQQLRWRLQTLAFSGHNPTLQYSTSCPSAAPTLQHSTSCPSAAPTLQHLLHSTSCTSAAPTLQHSTSCP